jgi:hypothetical protein
MSGLILMLLLLFWPVAGSLRMRLAKPRVYWHFAAKPWRWRRHRGPGVHPEAQPPPLAG